MKDDLQDLHFHSQIQICHRGFEEASASVWRGDCACCVSGVESYHAGTQRNETSLSLQLWTLPPWSMSLEFMADSRPKSLKGFEQSTADDSQNKVISVVKNIILSLHIVLNTASSSSPDSLKMEKAEHPQPTFGWKQEGRLKNTSRLKESERGKVLKTILKVNWGAHCCSGISGNKDSSTTYITDNKMTRREQKN